MVCCGVLCIETAALSLSHNRLNATLPTELGRCTNLEYMGVDSNDLTGTLPTEFGQLTKMEALVLSENRIDGSIPDQVCSLQQDHLLERLDADFCRDIFDRECLQRNCF